MEAKRPKAARKPLEKAEEGDLCYFTDDEERMAFLTRSPRLKLAHW